MSFDINNALVELIELSLVGNQAAAIDLANEIEEAHNQALEHCKQGDPVCTFHVIDGMLEPVYTNWAPEEGDVLFTHAMPKSDKEDAHDIDRLHINSDLLDDVLNWLRERDLYHDADYFSEGPDLAAILSAHEDELLRPWPTTPQPTTDISELITLINVLRAYIRTPSTQVLLEHSEHPLYPGKHQGDKIPLWDAIDTLIAKHTVK